MECKFSLYEMSTISNTIIYGDYKVIVHGSGDPAFPGGRQEHGKHFHIISKEEETDLSVNIYTLDIEDGRSWNGLGRLYKALIVWLKSPHSKYKDINYEIICQRWEDENQDKTIDRSLLKKI